MIFHEFSFIHWFLILLILLIFLKSIVTLFYPKAQDQLLGGMLLVVTGLSWIMHYFFPILLQPFLLWINSEILMIIPNVFLKMLIAVLLIVHGVKLVFKYPWKQIFVIVTILLFAVLHFFSSWAISQ